MVERTPIRDAELLDSLDNEELIDGYYDGFRGEIEPGDNRSLSYWHGWRNGAVDGGHRIADSAQALLAEPFLKSQRNKSP